MSELKIMTYGEALSEAVLTEREAVAAKAYALVSESRRGHKELVLQFDADEFYLLNAELTEQFRIAMNRKVREYELCVGED